MSKTIRMTLAEAQAKPFTAAERAHFAALAAKPDSQIDFSDQENITPEAIAAGHYVIIRRGGARVGAGRKPSGRQQVSLRLLPATVRRLRAQAKREGKTLSAVAESRLAAKGA